MDSIGLLSQLGKGDGETLFYSITSGPFTQSETEPLWKCLAKPDGRCQQFYDRMTIVGKKKALSFHHQEITNTSLKLLQSEIMQKNLTAKLTAELRENQRQWRTSTNKRPQAKNHRSAPKAAQATTLPAVDSP